MVSNSLYRAIQHRLHTHVLCTSVTKTHARAAAQMNSSRRDSHTCDHICQVGMLYDVISRCRHKIALFGVSMTWCASASNEDDLAGESGTRNFSVCNAIVPIRECSNNVYLLYGCFEPITCRAMNRGMAISPVGQLHTPTFAYVIM